MPRTLLPGRWNRHGRAIPDAQACELDSDVGIDMHQGRYATNPVPRVSPLAGVPTDEHYERTPEDDDYRSRFWKRLLLIYIGSVVCAIIISLVRHA